MPNQYVMERWRLTPLSKTQPRPVDGGFKTLNNKDNTLKHIVQSKTEQIYQGKKEYSNVDRYKMVLFVTCIVKTS